MGKRGTSITLEEKKKIEVWVLEGKTDEWIAQQLPCNIKTVRKYRKDVGLVKAPGGSLSVDVERVKTDNIASSNLTETEKLQIWRNNFVLSFRYKRLKDVLSPRELNDFVEQWCQYHLQFEDMKVSEEDMLEQMLMIKIRIDDNNRQRRMLQLQEESLSQQMSDKTLDIENENDRRLNEMILANNESMTSLTRDIKDLWEKFNQYQKALNATREQREKKEQIGGDTFLSLVKMFNKERERKRAGEYNELVKKATQRKEEEFLKPHEFADGGVEPIILRGKDFIDKDKKHE